MDHQKQIFTIQQISQKLNIPKPTLRFWEKELDGIIVPIRTQGGQRRYTAEHISIIEDIAALKTQGMSLAEIKIKNDNRNNAKRYNSDSGRVDLLADQIAEIVRAEVYRFLEGDREMEE